MLVIQSNEHFEYSLSNTSGLPNYVDYEDISSLEYIQGLTIDKPKKLNLDLCIIREVVKMADCFQLS